MSNVIFITDYNNWRIVKRFAYDLSYISSTSLTHSTVFNLPTDIVSNSGYLYVTDLFGGAVVKLLEADYSFVSRNAGSTEGIGWNGLFPVANNAFAGPFGITADGTYAYVCDGNGHNLKKILLSDLSYVAKVWNPTTYPYYGSGDNELRRPSGIVNDGTYVYIVDNGNGRIMKRRMSDLSYVSKFGSVGNGDNNFSFSSGGHSGITSDGTYLYISDTENHRIKKHLMDGTFVSKIGSLGSGNNQFNYPSGIANDGTCLYIADLANNRIKKHLMSDLSFVSSIGGPSSGTGNDQFNQPWSVRFGFSFDLLTPPLVQATIIG